MSEPRQKPEPVTGLRHVLAAATYSLGGLKRLWQETAFQHIVVMFFVCIGLHYAIGASLIQIGGFTIMVLLLVAVEALNTAIECLVDHLTEEWREFAKHAKDLGSLATMCLLLANGVYLICVIAVNFGLA